VRGARLIGDQFASSPLARAPPDLRVLGQIEVARTKFAQELAESLIAADEYVTPTSQPADEYVCPTPLLCAAAKATNRPSGRSLDD
jgi:hypothetical protein